MPLFLKTLRGVCKFCRQLAPECTKLMKVGIVLEFVTLDSYQGFQACILFVDLHWHLLMKCLTE